SYRISPRSFSYWIVMNGARCRVAIEPFNHSRRYVLWRHSPGVQLGRAYIVYTILSNSLAERTQVCLMISTEGASSMRSTRTAVVPARGGESTNRRIRSLALQAGL